LLKKEVNCSAAIVRLGLPSEVPRSHALRHTIVSRNPLDK